MTDAEIPKVIPRGVKKGGSRFPRYSLTDAIPWAKKLVSKTHLGPQPNDVVFAGVVGSKGPTGQIKVSALKQYGLLEGSAKAYVATELARAITAAPADEVTELYGKAALSPDVFSNLFTTFHGDEVTIAKLRQRASDLNVHPDETDRCVKLYVESLTFAALVSVAGENVIHVPEHRIATPSTNMQEQEETSKGETGGLTQNEIDRDDQQSNELKDVPTINNRSKANFTVNINLDSSMDIEKLQKHLELLRKYGAV